jgi:hypothetical protein
MFEKGGLMKQALICATILGIGLVGSSASSARQEQHQPAADVSALPKPVSPLSRTPSAIEGDRRVQRTVPPPRSSTWEQIQGPLDRSLGRIEDPILYDVRRIEQRRDERLGRIAPQAERQRFEEDRERQLRVEERQLRTEQARERPRRLELDRREYLLYLDGGSSALAGQIEADRQSLIAARRIRDQAFHEAVVAFDQASRQPGADQAELDNAYRQARAGIRGQFEETRGRILGY